MYDVEKEEKKYNLYDFMCMKHRNSYISQLVKYNPYPEGWLDELITMYARETNKQPHHQRMNISWIWYA